MSLKQFLRRSLLVNYIYGKYRSIKSRDYFCVNAKVVNNGYGTYKKKVDGKKNLITIGDDTRMVNTLFHIVGNNNSITIGKNCSIGANCSFWMEGNNISIEIGDGSHFTMLCHLNAQEEGSKIIIGKDCLFSNHIIVRTSDAHPIYDMITGKRINKPKSVVIGNHVWIAPDTKVLKGAIIGDGCIIGSNTMVTKDIPANTLAVGMPAKVVKTNVKWTSEDVIFNRIESL